MIQAYKRILMNKISEVTKKYIKDIFNMGIELEIN